MNGLVVGPKRLKVSLKKTPEACQKAQIQQLVRLSHNEELVDSVRDCTLFVFYLPSSWDDLRLSDEFSRCGRVTQCRVARGVGGCSMGYGFVTMEMAAGAARAMAMLNGLAVEESKRLKVSLKRRPAPVHGPHTVFVFHLPSWWGEEDLESAFSHVGSVSAAVMPRDAENRPQGYGFVSFSTEQSALLAVRSMDKTAVPDSYKRLHVSLKKKCLS
ncbi:MAG: hypothetical protein KVP17_003310 [Porospora cf. gigantea B]|nr:MAG: hypothetical protein KVP17_003310 [Porospora cf. gigantea B]